MPMNPFRSLSKSAVWALLPALVVLALVAVVAAPVALAQTPAPQQAAAEKAPAPHQGGGEASLKIPDLGQVSFVGVNARTLLMSGLGVCVLGLIFGLVFYSQLKHLPVHESMREISRSEERRVGK